MDDAATADAVLAWYDRHHRQLPWRVGPRERERGVRPDPYRVWLSEVMLQQTTVRAVEPYFRAFVERWPDVAALAAAGEDEVMRAWAGLGYYSRARNLKRCAERISVDHGGVFPSNEAALGGLPGIGPYTAAAIAAIAFDRPAAVVDGNIERVIARLERISMPPPRAKLRVRAAVARLIPAHRPGDFAQGLMDLGATVCTPKRPACACCPVSAACAMTDGGEAERFPARPAKAPRPVRRGAAFVAVAGDGAVWLRKRPPAGLLGGMAETPTNGWTARRDGAPGTAAAPCAGDWRPAGTVRHVFTHFELRLDVYRADFADRPALDGGWWAAGETLGREALPTVMRKALAAALGPGSV